MNIYILMIIHVRHYSPIFTAIIIASSELHALDPITLSGKSVLLWQNFFMENLSSWDESNLASVAKICPASLQQCASYKRAYITIPQRQWNYAYKKQTLISMPELLTQHSNRKSAGSEPAYQTRSVWKQKLQWHNVYTSRWHNILSIHGYYQHTYSSLAIELY